MYKVTTIVLVITFVVRAAAVPVPTLGAIQAIPTIPIGHHEGHLDEHLNGPTLNAGPFSTATKGLEDTAGFLFSGAATLANAFGTGIARLGTGLAGAVGASPDIVAAGQREMGIDSGYSGHSGHYGQQGMQLIPVVETPAPAPVIAAPAAAPAPAPVITAPAAAPAPAPAAAPAPAPTFEVNASASSSTGAASEASGSESENSEDCDC